MTIDGFEHYCGGSIGVHHVLDFVQSRRSIPFLVVLKSGSFWDRELRSRGSLEVQTRPRMYYAASFSSLLDYCFRDVKLLYSFYVACMYQVVLPLQYRNLIIQ